MKSLFTFTVALWLLTFLPGRASAFSSLNVFGDGLSTTTNNANVGPLYYGKRYCNGRVWVEVLAQRQGIGISNNWSYFGDYSSDTVANIARFPAPADAHTALFVVWVNNADFVGYLNQFNPPYTSASLPAWTNAMNVSLTNYFVMTTNLYAKGARTLIMPLAVDLMEIPAYDNFAASDRSFVRQRVLSYNSAFSNILSQAAGICPGLTIYTPNTFNLLDTVLTNAAAYGLTNTIYNQGQGNVSIDAITYYSLLHLSAATNGLGTNFIFWDNLDPTAAMQEVLADYVQQIISPASIGRVAALNGSNRLDVVNVPVGLNGFVDGCTNLVVPNWTVVTNFITSASTNTSQSVFTLNLSATNTGSPAYSQSGIGAGKASPADIGGLPEPGGTVVVTALQFYRLRFPYAWSWP